jgi:integrase
MPNKIDTQAKRQKLPHSPAPVFHKIAQGKHLGFRSTSRTWIARLHPLGGTRQFKPLGDETSMDFEQALEAARAWFNTANGPAPAQVTVAQAGSSYLTHLHDEKALTTYLSTKNYFDNHVFPQLGARLIAKLKTADYEDWHRKTGRRMAKKSFEVDADEKRRKARYAANHVLRLLKAALNRTFKANRTLPREEWAAVEEFKDGKTKPREVFLSEVESQRLINSCKEPFRSLVLAGLLTGARPGELFQMRVRDFDETNGLWNLSRGKTGPRTVVLTLDAVDLFKALCAGRAKSNLVFTRDDGAAWNKGRIRKSMRFAVRRAKLDPATVFYTLRHTYVSKLIAAGAVPQAISENVGTSLRMIEKVYGKFRVEDKRAMLTAGAMKLVVPEDKTVVALPR